MKLLCRSWDKKMKRRMFWKQSMILLPSLICCVITIIALLLLELKSDSIVFWLLAINLPLFLLVGILFSLHIRAKEMLIFDIGITLPKLFTRRLIKFDEIDKIILHPKAHPYFILIILKNGKEIKHPKSLITNRSEFLSKLKNNFSGFISEKE